MSARRQAVFSVARVISAAFLALAIVGPSPFGYLMWVFRTYEWVACFPLVTIYYALCGAVAGIFGGRRLALAASALCAVWASHNTLWSMLGEILSEPVDTYWVSQLVLTGIGMGWLAGFAVMAGVIGGMLSTKLGIDRIGRHPEVWTVVSLIGALLLTFSYGYGTGSASRLLRSEASRIVDKGTGAEINVHVTGIFPTVVIGPCSVDTREWFFGVCSYTYYTDPTGHKVIGKLRVLED